MTETWSTRTRIFRRSPATWVIIAIIFALIVGPELWQHRNFLVRCHFRTIVAGQLYASAFQGPRPLRNTLSEYRIKTVLSLVPEGTLYDRAEKRVANESAVRFRRVVMAGDMPADVLLAKAADAVAIMADDVNQPVLVHCRDGKHRTGLVIAVFRVSHCGWSVEQAEAELETGGASREKDAWVFRAFAQYAAHL